MVCIYKITLCLRDNWFISEEYHLNEADQASDVSSEFDEEQDEVRSLGGLSQYTFREEETKSRFTEYSMSSSVIRRNEQLTLLDDKFEKVSIY